MMRLSNARFAMLPSVLILSLLASSCASGGEKAQSNTAATNSNSATSNQSGADNSNGAAAGVAAPSAAKPKLNLNTASGDEFRANIPDLGDRMVHEFEEYRPYRSIQQFRREMLKYVAAEKIAEYERYVFVPIAQNESDAATLQQIPGLDAGEAQQLIAGRPYASRDAFISKLSEKVSAEELAVARTYLSDK